MKRTPEIERGKKKGGRASAKYSYNLDLQGKETVEITRKFRGWKLDRRRNLLHRFLACSSCLLDWNFPGSWHNCDVAKKSLHSSVVSSDDVVLMRSLRSC